MGYAKAVHSYGVVLQMNILSLTKTFRKINEVIPVVESIFVWIKTVFILRKAEKWQQAMFPLVIAAAKQATHPSLFPVSQRRINLRPYGGAVINQYALGDATVESYSGWSLIQLIKVLSADFSNTSYCSMVDNYTVCHGVGNVGDNLSSSSLIWFTTTPSVMVLEMLEMILLRQAW